MRASRDAFANTSTEDQLANQNLPLQALLKFISTECVASKLTPANATNVVDFVMQLLAENREHLYEMCRESDAVTLSLRTLEKSPTKRAHIQERGAKHAKIDPKTVLISLPTPLSTSIDAHVPNQCICAVASGMKRRDVRHLRQVFDQYKDGTGCLPACNLARALSAAAAPVIPSPDNISGMVKFSEFERAVALPDDLALYFTERRQPALADAFRALVGCGGDQLLRVSQLTYADVQVASSAVCACLPEQALELQEELQRSFAAQFEIQAQMEADPGKFNIVKMECGGIDDFHRGLTGRIGMPHMEFKDAMRQ